MAVSPLTLKRNQSQKYPYGYFVFFLHIREFYLVNETSIIFFSFNETENSLALVKTDATVKVRSAWRKSRGPENEFKDRQKE